MGTQAPPLQAKIHLFPQDALLGLYSSDQMGCLTPPREHQCRYRLGKEPTLTTHTIKAPWLLWLTNGIGSYYLHQVEVSQLPKFVLTPYAIANVDPVSGGICYHDTYPKNLQDAYTLFWSMAFDDSMAFRFFEYPGAPKSFAHACRRARVGNYYVPHILKHSCPYYTLPECPIIGCSCCRGGGCDCRCECCDGVCYCWGKRAAVPAHREWAVQLFTDFSILSPTWIQPERFQHLFSPEGWEIASGYRAVAVFFPDQRGNYRRVFANPQDPEHFEGPWVTETGEVVTPYPSRPR